jgi:prepilin-type N-terminal cleavage/methylation domain-containing protein
VSVRRGFTLVELLVVIGVIAVLAGLVLAVGSGVASRSERQQMQDAFSLLDQAIAELESARGQPLVFQRVNGTASDGLPFYDVVQLQVPFSDSRGADYIICALLELLMRNEKSREFLTRISPDLLRKIDTSNPNNEGKFVVGDKTYQFNYVLKDPWGETVKAYPCGRPATRGEIKKARDLIATGTSTATADPVLKFGIDLDDATVRTYQEDELGFACAGRQWLFFSKGPDGQIGRPPFDTTATDIQKDSNKDGIPDWSDNVLSHEPLRPNP